MINLFFFFFFFLFFFLALSLVLSRSNCLFVSLFVSFLTNMFLFEIRHWKGEAIISPFWPSSLLLHNFLVFLLYCMFRYILILMYCYGNKVLNWIWIELKVSCRAREPYFRTTEPLDYSTVTRGVGSLTVPDKSSTFLIFLQISIDYILIFPQIFLMFVLIFALRGNSHFHCYTWMQHEKHNSKKYRPAWYWPSQCFLFVCLLAFFFCFVFWRLHFRFLRKRFQV